MKTKQKLYGMAALIFAVLLVAPSTVAASQFKVTDISSPSSSTSGQQIEVRADIQNTGTEFGYRRITCGIYSDNWENKVFQKFNQVQGNDECCPEDDFSAETQSIAIASGNTKTGVFELTVPSKNSEFGCGDYKGKSNWGDSFTIACGPIKSCFKGYKGDKKQVNFEVETGENKCPAGNHKCEGNDWYTCKDTNGDGFTEWNNEGITVGKCSVDCKTDSDCQTDYTCESYKCETTCNSHANKVCYRGDSYWEDSCDNIEETADTCTEKEQCKDGKCVSSGECFRDSDCNDNDASTEDKCMNGQCFNQVKDLDGDGIPDNKDKCMDKAGIKELNGCPPACQSDADCSNKKSDVENGKQVGTCQEFECSYNLKCNQGYKKKDSKCVKEEPEVPWGIIGLIAGIVTVILIAIVFLGKEEEAKRRLRSMPGPYPRRR